jgi:alpha-mannosidase
MMTIRDRLLLASCLMAAGLTALPAHSQVSTTRQLAQFAATLPPVAQAVLTHLGTLSILPAGEWRTHAGDLAHGEDPNLDDSGWQVAQLRAAPTQESVWYRRWIEVPKNLNGYDLTGARIWFHFRAASQIVYFDGRRVALGDDLEPLILFDKAKPGERILVAVKLPRTADAKTFTGADLTIDFAAGRPNPDDLRKELLTAAVLLPSLSKNLAVDRTVLDKAFAQVDLKALDAQNQAQFDASVKAADGTLAALKPMLQQATFFETGNSHIDAAWLWPVSETIDVVRRTFTTALQLMDEYPWYTYTQSAAAYNEWIAAKYPAINEEIKRRIKEGRWEIVGGMWVEPDLNIPDGESQTRSILLGKRFFQKEYGVDVRIGWNPDSFGYNWQTPQIYKKSGIDYFVTQKMEWNDTNQLPFKLFWWQSPDGSKVLTYFPHSYSNNNLNPTRLAMDLSVARTYAPGLTEMMDLYGIGDHGGGATRSILDEGAHWSTGGQTTPNMKFGTAANFFSTVEKQIAPNSPVVDYDVLGKGYTPPQAPPAGQIAIPTMNSELYFEYHRGVQTTQANQKRSMRESEIQTLNAEKFASLAWLDGVDYPSATLTDAWKKVTFNDFHDLAAGSGIGVIYKEAQEDFQRIRLETGEITNKSLGIVAARVDTRASAGTALLVFNSLAWNRSGLVEADVQMPSATKEISILDSQNQVLPSQILFSDHKTNSFRVLIDAKNIPSMGYEVLQAVPGKRAFASDLKIDGLKNGGLTMENAALRVVVDKTTGCISSLFDKTSNFESLTKGGCGNDLQAFKDQPRDWDAWNIDPGTLDVPPIRLPLDKAELIESGPMRSVIRVTRSWQKSKFVQDIQLYAGSNKVNIVNDIDWHEEHVLLKVAFPLAASSQKATYEIPFGTIARPTTRNNSYEKAQFEVPAQRWADLGDGQHGFSLINESKYGYDAVGNVLRLSLLRSPVNPDPEADRGHHHFSFAVMPHAGDWKKAMTVREGYGYNYKLTAMQVARHAGTLPARHAFVSVTPENVVLTAMKKAEDDNGLVLHMYEWAGKSASVNIAMPNGATSATVVNLLEKPQGAALQVLDGHINVPIKPYEILAVRFDYPAAK